MPTTPTILQHEGSKLSRVINVRRRPDELGVSVLYLLVQTEKSSVSGSNYAWRQSAGEAAHTLRAGGGLRTRSLSNRPVFTTLHATRRQEVATDFRDRTACSPGTRPRRKRSTPAPISARGSTAPVCHLSHQCCHRPLFSTSFCPSLDFTSTAEQLSLFRRLLATASLPLPAASRSHRHGASFDLFRGLLLAH